jgi:hypothetical protein
MSLARRALQSATRPLHLAPLGVGLAVGGGLLAVGLPPLALLVGGLSLGTSGALVAWELLAPAPKPESRPTRAAIRSATLRKALEDVDRAAGKVSARLVAHDGVLGASFVELTASVRALVEQAEALASRGDAVHAFLGEHDPAEIEREVQSRLVAARNVGDAEAAGSFRSAAAAKRRQLELWTELRGLFERVSAELVSVEAVLDELDARVVRLSLLDPGGAAAAGRDASREMQAVRQRVGILEQAATRTLREVGQELG